MTLLYLAGAVFSELSATLALRAAIDAPWWYALVVVGYVASFVALAGVLQRGMNMSVAYAIWSACGVMLSAILSAALFGERLTWLMVLGFAFLIAGVVVIEHDSRPPLPDEPATP